MAIYYFATDDGLSRPERQALDLPDLEAARQEALRRMRLQVLDLNPAIDAAACFVVAVSDAQRSDVLTVRLAFSVDPG